MAENVESRGTGEVIVGMDRSANAMRAAEWAAAEAAGRGVPLALVHAIDAGKVSIFPPSDYVEQVRGDARELLGRIAEGLQKRFPGVPVRTVVSDFSPARALTELSEQAELVVTGSRGHGGFAGLLIGSTSRKLAAHAHCPLVVVRDGLVAQTLDEVVLGVEPGQDEAPIRFAFATAARYRATLHAVRVWHPLAVYSSVAGGYCEDLGETRAEQTREVETLLEPVASAHPEVKVEISTGRGNTVPVLIETARGTRLLVVGAHRRRGPLAVGAGYVVDGLLAHAPTPVAVVPID